MIVKITPNDKDNPPGKLADAELHFTDGVLDGLKLIGFAVWERRSGSGRNVTFPARQYSVNGERRTLRAAAPGSGDATAQDRVRELILQAYAEYEERGAPSARDVHSRSGQRPGAGVAFSFCRFGGSVHSSRSRLVELGCGRSWPSCRRR